MKGKTVTAEPTVARLLANHRKFIAYVRRRVESDEAAEEILQSAYARGLEKSNSLRDTGKVTAWFYRVLRNSLFDHYRRRGAEAKALAGLSVEEERKAERRDAALERTVCRCVNDVMATLKPEYADVLKQTEVDEERVSDIARRKKTTPTNISVRLHRARAALRTRLLETCGACAQHACVDCTCRRSDVQSPDL